MANTAVLLARRFGEDENRAYLAGILHDCAKWMTPSQMLVYAAEKGFIPDEHQQRMPGFMHAQLGAIMARDEYGVDDEAVLRAIALHQSGEPGMTRLDVIINLADLIEPGRDFPQVGHLRDLAQEDLEAALYAGLGGVMIHVLGTGGFLYPPIVDTYNWLWYKTTNKEADT